MFLKKYLMLIAILMLSPGSSANPLLSGISGDNEKPQAFDTTPIVDLRVGPEQETLHAVARFPNGCYNPFHSFKGTKENKLVLVHMAQYPKEAICSRIVQYQDVEYTIENLEPGVYDIIDGDDGAKIAELIKEQEQVQLVEKE